VWHVNSDAANAWKIYSGTVQVRGAQDGNNDDARLTCTVAGLYFLRCFDSWRRSCLFLTVTLQHLHHQINAPNITHELKIHHRTAFIYSVQCTHSTYAASKQMHTGMNGCSLSARCPSESVALFQVTSAFIILFTCKIIYAFYYL